MTNNLETLTAEECLAELAAHLIEVAAIRHNPEIELRALEIIGVEDAEERVMAARLRLDGR